MDDDTGEKVASWFDASELDDCPTCGVKGFTKPDQLNSVRVCVSCGFVELVAAEPTP
jgi:hypothetical protein